MVYFIMGRIFYYLAKFEPIEEAALYDTTPTLASAIKLTETLWSTQAKINSGEIKIEDNQKFFGKHVDTYDELKEDEVRWSHRKPKVM